MRHTRVTPTLIASLYLLPLAASAQESAETPAPTEDEPALQQKVQELEAQLQAMENRLSEDELQRLVERAEMVAIAPPEEENPEDRVFTSAARAMQITNPEISISGDMLTSLAINEDMRAGNPVDSGFPLRALSMHVQSVLDPYSLFKAALEFYPGETTVNLEELFISWHALIPSTSITVGRFRQNFGVVNRWHQHDLDQTDYPLALYELFGNNGVMGNGVSFKWFMPSLWAHAQELTIDVTDGDNPDYLSQESFWRPAAMAHLKNYYDLSESTYLELGLSGQYGYANDPARVETADEALARGADPEAADYAPLNMDGDWATTVASGADLTLYWSPLQHARYRSITWRSELYMLQRQDEAGDWANGMGGYSYFTYQLGASWFAGVRGDWVKSMDEEVSEAAMRVVPYATFWQSEFVYLRGEYWYTRGLDDEPEHRILFQLNWAAGPHKHERY